MDIKQNRNDSVDNKNKAKSFWKNVGLIALALMVAIITVFVLNIDK